MTDVQLGVASFHRNIVVPLTVGARVRYPAKWYVRNI
jgi:hypothetical protein